VLHKRGVELIELLLLVGILSAALAWLRTNNLVKNRALRENERQLAEAQRITHMGNWAWDFSRGSLNWSEEIYRIFGRKPQPSAASYEAFLDAIHPDDRKKVVAAIDAAIIHKAPYAIDHRIVRPDGTVRFVHERGAVQIDHAGRPVRMLGTVHDITESMEAAQALRQSEVRYRNLFENMIDGYVLYETLFDDQGRPCDYRCLEVNPAFERILGLARNQAVGKTLLEIFPTIEAYWLELFGNVAVTGQSQHLERYAQPLGRYFDTTVSCPERGLVAVFFSDITERKKSEQQLRKYRDELEAKVAKRTAALEASNKELETFSYSIAHDLRTPLRSITSFSQILEQEAGPKLSEEQCEDLRRIVRAGQRMSELIDDILELARISRAKFKVETVDLSALAYNIVENLQEAQEKRSVQVDIEPNLHCKGDAALLDVIMQNLLSNAWKYTCPCAKAHIEFGETTIDNEKVYYVRDNGVGFNMQYVNKLFKPFARLHSSDEFTGTGIGLVSVLSAIQRHHGKIWAESTEGHGATFYFILPE
jgi:PAS domain S-box-containing protein